MKILITGKNSYIGNSFFEWVKEHEPTFEVNQVSLRNVNLSDLSFKGYDVIFHVAGIAHITSSKKLIPEYFRVNRDLAIEVAKKAKEEGVKQFIFTSSMAIYGDDFPIGFIKPIDINLPKPTNVYGQSKLEADLEIQKLNDTFFKTVILRIPMVYGKEAKGNFLKLFSFANSNALNPQIINKRSVLNINNLSEIIRVLIQQSKSGIYYPQDKEHFTTSNFIKKVRDYSGKKTINISFLNSMIKLLSIAFKNLNKIYGNKYYDSSFSIYDEINYQVSTLEEMIQDYFNSLKF
jgi:UDP-glucose 4-epimerase